MDMIKHVNKTFLVLLFAAVLSFTIISVGGEFLHGKIHHHNDQSSHDQCSFYLLQTQVTIAAVAIIIAAIFKFTPLFISIHRIFVFQLPYYLPSLRAPPVAR